MSRCGQLSSCRPGDTTLLKDNYLLKKLQSHAPAGWLVHLNSLSAGILNQKFAVKPCKGRASISSAAYLQPLQSCSVLTDHFSSKSPRAVHQQDDWCIQVLISALLYWSSMSRHLSETPARHLTASVLLTSEGLPPACALKTFQLIKSTLAIRHIHSYRSSVACTGHRSPQNAEVVWCKTA